MLTILGKTASINVRKVLWTCGEMGLSYRREDWGAGFRSTHEPEFLKLNPHAMVPVLKDEEIILWESNTICRYLAQRQDRVDLLPRIPEERAQVEKWMDWQISELGFSWRYVFMARIRQSPQHQDPAQIEAGIENWRKQMAILEHYLQKDQPYLTGNSFTLADIVIGLSVHRWFSTMEQSYEFPAISAYYQRLSTRPAFIAQGCNLFP